MEGFWLVARALRSASADLRIKKVALARGLPLGIAPQGFGEDTVGGESGHVGLGDAVEEAGTVELLRGKGEFEVRGGGGGRGLALTDRPALICQHLGSAELAHAIADAVVDAGDEEEPGFDEVCLHTEGS